MEEKYYLRTHIYCPICNHKQSDEFMYEQCVTYWGEEHIVNCGGCGAIFVVEEIVDRRFASRIEEMKL